MVGIRSGWTRKRLVVLAVFVGVAAYVFVAIWMQPVALGSNATFTGIPGHNPTKEAGGGRPVLTPKEMVGPDVHRGGVPVWGALGQQGAVRRAEDGVWRDTTAP